MTRVAESHADNFHEISENLRKFGGLASGHRSDLIGLKSDLGAHLSQLRSPLNSHVRFGPNLTRVPQQTAHLVDHLVSGDEQRLRHLDAKHPGRS